MFRPVLLLSLLWGATCAGAQGNTIQWRTDPRQAVEEAKRTLRPLMIYVHGSSTNRGEHADDLERDQKRALASPKVLRLAQRFVPLKLTHSQHRDVFKDFDIRPSADLEMKFVSPDGKVLRELGGGGVAQAESLAQTLGLVLQAYGKTLYETEVKPKLENAEAKPEELKLALKLVQEYQITSADAGVVGLVGREKLDPGVRQLAYDTLSDLSTRSAVEKLAALLRDGDKAAEKALEKASPVAAEMLLGELKADAEKFDYPVYKLVTKICQVRGVKTERYFEKANTRDKTQELERVKKLVAEAAKRWKAEHEDGG